MCLYPQRQALEPPLEPRGHLKGGWQPWAGSEGAASWLERWWLGACGGNGPVWESWVWKTPWCDRPYHNVPWATYWNFQENPRKMEGKIKCPQWEYSLEEKNRCDSLVSRQNSSVRWHPMEEQLSSRAERGVFSEICWALVNMQPDFKAALHWGLQCN